MSIPRLAIHRPVTMFMLSAVIVLLGAISLTKLPVDLMPEFTQPTITVNTNYANVGPLEIEELITRPIEQSVSAVAGITRVDSSSREGGSNVRLNFAWGTNLDAAADDVRSRLDRVRGRLPEEAGSADDLQGRLQRAADHADRRRRRLRPRSPCASSPKTTCRRGWSARRAWRP